MRGAVDDRFGTGRQLRHPVMLSRELGAGNSRDSPDRQMQTPIEFWDTTGAEASGHALSWARSRQLTKAP